MNKLIYKYEDVSDEILKAVDIIADPVIQTLSPKGSNVMFEDINGNQKVTNDGHTIAQNISIKDPLKNAIIDMIKQPALQTNHVAGDGTTTTILFSKVLIKGGAKLLAEGMNRMDLKSHMEDMGDKIKANLKKQSIKINGTKDIYKIAKISGNNDDVVAKDVERIIEVVGEDGMIFLEPHYKSDTELIEETGFSVDSPLDSNLVTGQTNSVNYEDVPVLMTDKRLYYTEEAETILKVALESGWKSVIVVARDFIGKSLNYFIANHKQGVIKVLLVKDPSITEKDSTNLEDLATYLGGKIVSDKTGSLVNKVKGTDFVMAKKVVSNPLKTVFVTAKPNNTELKARVKLIKDELAKVKDDKKLKGRLSNLTKGSITVKVGGRTPIEVQERLYRYEDAINASRAALRDGYLVGGGLALIKSYNDKEQNQEIKGLAKSFTEASIRQIAKNCGKHEETILEQIVPSKDIGYNAKSNKIENLLDAGVIDPYKVTEMAVDNAISIAVHILSSGYLIINDTTESDE